MAALLGADRAFAAASARTTVIPALTAMFADDVIMQAPGGMMRGKTAATEALRANAANATARLDWAPLRGGISADGQHGFKFGYMTMTPIAGSPVPLKYLSYWVKRDGTWRVAAYKRRPRPAGDVSTAMIAPAVPAQLVPASSDQAVVTGHRLGLVAAEQAFSDEAQRIGLGAAFTKFGWPDAMNRGGPNDSAFVDDLGEVIPQKEKLSSAPFESRGRRRSPARKRLAFEIRSSTSLPIGLSEDLFKTSEPERAGHLLKDLIDI